MLPRTTTRYLESDERQTVHNACTNPRGKGCRALRADLPSIGLVRKTCSTLFSTSGTPVASGSVGWFPHLSYHGAVSQQGKKRKYVMKPSASHGNWTSAAPVQYTRPLLIRKLSFIDGGATWCPRGRVQSGIRSLKGQQRYSVSTHQRRPKGSVTTRSRSFTSDTCGAVGRHLCVTSALPCVQAGLLDHRRPWSYSTAFRNGPRRCNNGCATSFHTRKQNSAKREIPQT